VWVRVPLGAPLLDSVNLTFSLIFVIIIIEKRRKVVVMDNSYEYTPLWYLSPC
jgi:hypothetical protein